MLFSSSRNVTAAFGVIAALAVGSTAAVAKKNEGAGNVLKPFQKQQAQDYAKSKQLSSSSKCVGICKQRPANYGCKVLIGVAAGAGAGLETCCKKACGG